MFKQIALRLSLVILALIIFTASIMNQSADQTSRSLGLASPRPLIVPRNQIDILVPLHGNFTLQSSGWLPSHPLYPAQMVVDRIKLVLTFNPETRTRRLLTYSNIRMSAANQLAESGETDLAVTTAIKGQAYLWQAISHSSTIPSHLQPEWYDLLKQTALKHEEIIERIRFVARDSARDQAHRLWEQLGEYRQQIANLSGSPFNYPRPEDEITNVSDQPYL